MLFFKNLFLTLDFRTQLFFCGKEEHVFGGKKLFVSVKNGESRDIGVRIRTENDSQSRVVSFGSLQFIKHPDVHIHLSDILMRYLCGLQIHQDKAFQDEVVENEVNEIVFLFRVDAMLAGDERIAFS